MKKYQSKYFEFENETIETNSSLSEFWLEWFNCNELDLQKIQTLKIIQ